MLAYHAVDIPVRTQPITREARARLGPWVRINLFRQPFPCRFSFIPFLTKQLQVVKNMFGIVNFPQKTKHKRLGAVGPNASASSSSEAAGVSGIAPDRYDFLEPWTVKYPTAVLAPLEDMHLVTADLKSGLVLVPDRFGPRGPLKDVGLTARADRVKATARRRFIIKPEGQEGMDVDIKEDMLEEAEQGRSKVADDERAGDVDATLETQVKNEPMEVEAGETSTVPTQRFTSEEQILAAVSLPPHQPEPGAGVMHTEAEDFEDEIFVLRSDRINNSPLTTLPMPSATKLKAPSPHLSEPTSETLNTEEPNDPYLNSNASQQSHSSQNQSTALVPYDFRIAELWNRVLALRYTL